MPPLTVTAANSQAAMANDVAALECKTSVRQVRCVKSPVVKNGNTKCQRLSLE